MKYTNVQLIFPEYHPDQLEKGMYFVSMHGLVQDNPYVHIYELDVVPRDQGKYIEKHGLPVRPYLVMSTSTNPDIAPTIVAHPHQIYLEFISEHGLFGTTIILYVIFFILYQNIKIYKKNKNIIHLSSILFVAQTFLPLIPSGSFFASWTATVFWLNFAIMLTFAKRKT